MAMTREQVLLCEVWRRAFQKGEYALPCKDKKEAQRVRFALYNAVSFARKPGATVDQVLAQAVEACSVFLQGDSVVVRKKEILSKLEAMLGPQENELNPTERAAQEIAERLLAEAQEVGKGPAAPETKPQERATPYYTRKD